MRLTHFGHACLLVQTASARLLIDPGTFSSGFEDERELTAVLITHQHADHVDTTRLAALLDANPGVELVADTATAEQLAGHGITARAASAGERFDFGGTTVDTVGGKHAVIHEDIPVVPNIGYLVDDVLLHPGDSFHVPDRKVDVLALPTGAPWLKASEAIDYLRAVAPRLAVPIHEAVLARPEMMYGMFERLGPSSSTVRVLTPGEPAEV